jgi:hypothetical protein
MLRYRGIEADEPDRCVYRIDEDDAPVPHDALERVARIAGILVAENRLPGTFAAGETGELVLLLRREERGFFHNGIVFAALDAVNDPVRNPTLTLRAEEKPP